MRIIELAFLIVGSCIGAGFATGAEIAVFFSQFNLPSYITGFYVFAALSLLISLIAVSANKRKEPPKLLNIIFMSIYFTLFTAMTAGIKEIAGVWVSALSLLISVITVFFGFDKMAKFNAVIVCFIIVILLTVCQPYLYKVPYNISLNPQHYNLLLWSFLYAGLNCCMLPEIITAAGKKTPQRKIIYAVITASAIIAVFVYLILNTVTATGTQNTPMPLYSVSHTPITFTVIILAILTSQFSALFAITQKCRSFNFRRRKTVAIAAALFAFICSFAGFSKLVGTFYPIIGLIFLIYLSLSFFLPLLFSSQKR